MNRLQAIVDYLPNKFGTIDLNQIVQNDLQGRLQSILKFLQLRARPKVFERFMDARMWYGSTFSS